MDDLRARAAELFRGPYLLPRVSDNTCPINLLWRYAAGESWDTPDMRERLSAGIRRAEDRAAGPTEPTGAPRDAQEFYRRAAALLQEIAAAMSADRANPGATPDPAHGIGPGTS